MSSRLFHLLFCYIALSVCGWGQTDPARQFFNQQWIAKNFSIPTQSVLIPLASSNTVIQKVSLDTSTKHGHVLPTHFGVNTPFRNGSNQRTRKHLYNGTVNVVRFPAGSGSNTYFFDGMIPNDMEDYIDSDGSTKSIMGINGLQSSAMTPDTFIYFKNDINGNAIVVINYFYARYGKTTANTRAARVQQAASYAASFVRKLNIQLGGNVKYWEIGNECYGKWETGYNVANPSIGIVTGKEYGEDFKVFVDSMKAVDPGIKIGAVVKDISDSWNQNVLPEVKDDADFLSVHNYFTTEAQATKFNILNSVSQIQTIKTTIQNDIVTFTGKAADYYPIAMTEFNSRGPYNCSMVNALFVSQILGEVIKNKFGLSALWVSEWNWDSVDQESKGFLAKNDPHQEDFSYRQSYIPFYYYNRVFGDNMVQCMSDIDSVKVYGSVFSSGHMGLVIINTSKDTQSLRISALNGSQKFALDKMYWYEMWANTLDTNTITYAYKKFFINGITSVTTGGGPANLDNVLPYESTIMKNSIIKLKPHSIQFIALVASNHYIFEGTTSSEWNNDSNWDKGCKPPTGYKGMITINANCTVQNGTPFTLNAGSNIIINSGKTLTWKW